MTVLSNLDLDHVGLYDEDPLCLRSIGAIFRSSVGLLLHLKEKKANSNLPKEPKIMPLLQLVHMKFFTLQNFTLGKTGIHFLG